MTDDERRKQARLLADEVAKLLRQEQFLLQKWLTPEEAATYTKLTLRGLEQMRGQKRGPRYVKPGPRIVRYHIGELDRWLRSDSARVPPVDDDKAGQSS